MYLKAFLHIPSQLIVTIIFVKVSCTEKKVIGCPERQMDCPAAAHLCHAYRVIEP